VPAFVIGNGADPGRFRRLEATAIGELRQRLDLVGARTILTVGNLTERKGQEVVISALPEVLRKVPEARYLMVGLPTEEPRLRTLSESLGVSDAVRFVGYLKHQELVAAYNCCDVFAMTSQHTAAGDFEGYGIAVVEAALCAKPAVVSEGSGLEEAVVAGETALVVPQSDVPATADALVTLLGDESLRARLGQAAQERALAEQTWRARAVDYDWLLRSLTKGSQAAADLRPDSGVLS
jgi:phosphatidylinositol alpha-1,6-mannosyltransferase